MKKIARIVSNLFSPLLVSSYGVLASLCCSTLDILVPLSTKLTVAGVTFFITGILPMLFISSMYFSKRVSTLNLENRTERTIPYVFASLCYVGCAFYLHSIHAPSWLWTFPIGGAIAVVVSLMVNRRWKISAHLAGMGGVTAIFFRIAVDGAALPGIVWWVVASILITGLLGTARIELGRHTLGQTLAGAANGFFWVFLLSSIKF